MCNKLEEDNRKMKFENQHMLDKILQQKRDEVEVINMQNEMMKRSEFFNALAVL